MFRWWSFGDPNRRFNFFLIVLLVFKRWEKTQTKKIENLKVEFVL